MGKHTDLLTDFQANVTKLGQQRWQVAANPSLPTVKRTPLSGAADYNIRLAIQHLQIILQDVDPPALGKGTLDQQLFQLVLWMAHNIKVERFEHR